MDTLQRKLDLETGGVMKRLLVVMLMLTACARHVPTNPTAPSNASYTPSVTSSPYTVPGLVVGPDETLTQCACALHGVTSNVSPCGGSLTAGPCWGQGAATAATAQQASDETAFKAFDPTPMSPVPLLSIWPASMLATEDRLWAEGDPILSGYAHVQHGPEPFGSSPNPSSQITLYNLAGADCSLIVSF